ncbi:MAG: hypothetical protein ACLP1X_26440 [Polyangiaceae bacterium]
MWCKTTAKDRVGRRFIACAAAAASAIGLASRARADPLRLRADALAETQGAASPTGLVVLQGEDAMRPWVSAEALVWAGAGAASVTGDVLVLSLRVHEPHGYAEARVGRFVLATGAVHPVQIDGAHVTARAPWGSTVETFGGLPVVPRFGTRSYDWLAGGRVAQRVANAMTLGVSYVQRREDGEISNEEVGADLATAPARWLDLAAFGAYDVTSPGLAEARASAAARWSDWRFELFASQLSPGRLLPATSLFSVLGDLPSQTLGATVRWRAAPRLDLLASGAGQDVAAGLGGNGWLRATLRLDDRGSGSLGLEMRRVDIPETQWTGARAIAALPLGRGFRYSSEIEIVVPDHPDGRGAAWPWGLSSLSWRSPKGWEVAGALEASSTPVHRYEADALVRLSCALDSGPANPATPGQPTAIR